MAYNDRSPAVSGKLMPLSRVIKAYVLIQDGLRNLVGDRQVATRKLKRAGRIVKADDAMARMRRWKWTVSMLLLRL